jgi:hypothetical protein
MSIATDSVRKPAEANRSSTVQAIVRWLEDSPDDQCGLEYAQSALLWCRCLPKLADQLSAAVWRQLIKHLVQLAVEAGSVSADAVEPEGDPLVHQLLAGELALTLACLFPKIKACRRLLPQARQALSSGLGNLLDGEGLLHARHFDRLRPLLACWARCLTLGKRHKRRCWSAKADARFRQFVRNALRLTRRDGSQVFSSDCPDLRVKEIDVLKAAVAMLGNQNDRAIASTVLPGGKKIRRELKVMRLPPAPIHSEWAATAVLRPDWRHSSPRLTVLYPDKSCRVELGCGKDVLWSGQWGFDVRLDGLPVPASSEWFETCWISDKDVDYLELEIELDRGIRLQRHFLMAKKDRFLLLADAVLGSQPTVLEYRGTWPLCSGVQFHRALETREGGLLGQKARAMAIPLALPEWLADVPQGSAGIARNNEKADNMPLFRTSSAEAGPSPDTACEPSPARAADQFALQSDETTLELRQSTFGSSLFAPLFFDLDRRRFRKPYARIFQHDGHDCRKCGLTWRQLAVAESLTVQPADVAVGYRVAVGGKQWLIYRSLTPPRNRTLLGHNISSELLVARFQRNGEVVSLIEME